MQEGHTLALLGLSHMDGELGVYSLTVTPSHDMQTEVGEWLMNE